MIKFGLSFETPARPGLLRLNSQFSFSPPPITTTWTFRVSTYSEGGGRFHLPSSSYPRHELNQIEACRTIFGSQKGIVMGAANA